MNGYSQSIQLSQAESKGCWIVMEVLCFLALLFLLTLLCMHSHFAVTNWTTWESTKRAKIWYLKSHRGERSPFDLGAVRNVREVFCHANYPVEWTIIDLDTSAKELENHPEELSMCI
eukprot:TRINITY_DN17453_c0_g1_i2.p3 TRINITY_DN17453_c0_g1~~TRINITY_DN17453_c0_g1_i2.p3  ORF type:complete len:117 (+),score=25.33 TRINITY_DN17453_c0_g1_i2:492-842(+)